VFQNVIPNAALAAAPTHPRKQVASNWQSKARGAVGTVIIGGGAALIGLLEVGTVGALNGGTVPPTSAFTPLKTWVQTNFLGSDWVLVIGFMALVVLVWGLMHGKGWGAASIVLGILAAALLGPNLVIAAATATREPVPAISHVDPSPRLAVPAGATFQLTAPAASARTRN
jgi:hypothetical protein